MVPPFSCSSPGLPQADYSTSFLSSRLHHPRPFFRALVRRQVVELVAARGWVSHFSRMNRIDDLCLYYRRLQNQLRWKKVQPSFGPSSRRWSQPPPLLQCEARQPLTLRLSVQRRRIRDLHRHSSRNAFLSFLLRIHLSELTPVVPLSRQGIRRRRRLPPPYLSF